MFMEAVQELNFDWVYDFANPKDGDKALHRLIRLSSHVICMTAQGDQYAGGSTDNSGNSEYMICDRIKRL